MTGYEFFGEYFFIGYLIAAVFLWMASDFPGKRWMLFALIAWAFPGLVFFFEIPVGYEFYELFQYLQLAALLSFVVGAFLLATGSSAGIRGGRKVIMKGAIGDQATSTVPRNESNSITRAEQARDAIYEYFTEALKETGVSGEVFKSMPYSELIWVVVQIYDPVEGSDTLSYRASVEVTVEPLDFRKYDHQLKVVLDDGRKRKKYWPVIDFHKENAVSICNFLGGKTRKLSVKFLKSRVLPMQLWRPENKLAGVKAARNFPLYLIAAGLVTLSLPFLGVPLLIAGVIWAAVRWFQRDRVLSLTTGKPMHEPRILLGMDSWQTVLYDLAPYAEDLKRQIRERLSSGAQNVPERSDGQPARIEVQSERIWHQGVDGKVEREQLVVRLRRAVAFVHIYSYGDDLYVGWAAHLNGGSWVEKGLGKFKELSTGKVANAYKIEPSWQAPGEYDITDANFLLETVHSVVKKVIRQALAEHKIDQEIDFSIVREARKDIAGSGRPGSEAQEKKSRFKRVA